LNINPSSPGHIKNIKANKVKFGMGKIARSGDNILREDEVSIGSGKTSSSPALPVIASAFKKAGNSDSSHPSPESETAIVDKTGSEVRPASGHVTAKISKSVRESDGFIIAPASNTAGVTDSHKTPTGRDTFVFVLNSSGETNLCKPLIAAVKKKGYNVKVIHFRENSKEILTSQGILNDEDFIDGTNALYLPRMKSIFKKEIDPDRIVKLVGTPHHAFCRSAFSNAKKAGIPTVALVDLGIPGTGFKYRHTFYKTLTMADKIIVPNDTIRKRLEANNKAVAEKSGFSFDNDKISTGGNPGFEAFRLLVDLNRSKADEIRNELGIGKDDLVFAFSSQPTPNNGKVLEITGHALKKLSERNPGKKIHILLNPHPRDLHKVGLKNIFGTETSISIPQKVQILEGQLKDAPNVVVHEMPKYTMEKASAISNVVLTETSTTAYECAHSDIPAIFVRAPQQGAGGSFPQYKRIPTAKTADALAGLIEKTLANPPKNLSKDLSKVVTSDLTPYMDVLLPEG